MQRLRFFGLTEVWEFIRDHNHRYLVHPLLLCCLINDGDVVSLISPSKTLVYSPSYSWRPHNQLNNYSYNQDLCWSKQSDLPDLLDCHCKRAVGLCGIQTQKSKRVVIKRSGLMPRCSYWQGVDA